MPNSRRPALPGVARSPNRQPNRGEVTLPAATLRIPRCFSCFYHRERRLLPQVLPGLHREDPAGPRVGTWWPRGLRPKAQPQWQGAGRCMQPCCPTWLWLLQRPSLCRRGPICAALSLRALDFFFSLKHSSKTPVGLLQARKWLERPPGMTTWP